MTEPMNDTCKVRLLCNSNIFLTKLQGQALRASLQAIHIGDAHVIITLVSTKQVYNGKVKLFNKI